MSNTITIRLTPDRERLLKLFKMRYHIEKNTDAIELALKIGFESDIDYRTKLERVAGCLQGVDNRNAVDMIRELRDNR